MPQHFARCHHVTVSQHGSVWNDILAMGHGKKAKPFFKRCLINLVLLCFAYFCNPNLGTGNCLWLLPWPVLWLGWLLATLSFHPSWVVFSCCCEQRTCDPQGGGTGWLQTKGHWQPGSPWGFFHPDRCLSGEFKHSARTFQHASASCWLVVKSSLGEMSTLCKTTRSHPVYVQHKNSGGRCKWQTGRREGGKD